MHVACWAWRGVRAELRPKLDIATSTLELLTECYEDTSLRISATSHASTFVTVREERSKQLSPLSQLQEITVPLGEGKWGHKKYRRIPKCEGD